MKRGTSWTKILLVIALVLLALLGGIYLGARYRYLPFVSRSPSAIDKLQATLTLIDRNYVDSLSTDSLVQELLPDLMNHLDPHSSYLSKEAKMAEREAISGSFFGIGVTFNMIKDTAIIISVVPNGPSDIAGVVAGERIISVDHKSIEGEGFQADSIRSILRGEEGTRVLLGLRNPANGEVREVQVRRGAVNIRQVEASYMINDSLGAIELRNFGMHTFNDFMQAVAKLRGLGAKGLVLDLRDNPGGLLDPALKIANEMLPSGSSIIYTEGYRYPREDLNSTGTGNLIGAPIYVLINESSASSSEIVAGALQDNDVAIIVGRRSFGKGLVQKAFDFKDGSSIHLTVARYYTPSGRSIQREYQLGDSQGYAHDWLDRLGNGELFNKDSIVANRDLIYTSKAGRTLYGGGGITPDIFIPRDTAGFTSYFGEVFSKGILHEFAFIYADKHGHLLKRLASVDELYKFLNNQGLAWQLADYAWVHHGVRKRSYLIYLSESLIEQILIPQIVEYLHGIDESRRVRSFDDPAIKVIEQLFSEGIYSPLEITDDYLTPLHTSNHESKATTAERDSLYQEPTE